MTELTITDKQLDAYHDYISCHETVVKIHNEKITQVKHKEDGTSCKIVTGFFDNGEPYVLLDEAIS